MIFRSWEIVYKTHYFPVLISFLALYVNILYLSVLLQAVYLLEGLRVITNHIKKSSPLLVA